MDEFYEPSRPALPPLTDEQKQGFEEVRNFVRDSNAGPFFSIQGVAGTGKTVLLSTIARFYQDTILATPTGKAADVLRKKTGMPVQTLHSVFYNLREIRKRQDGSDDLRFELAHDDGALWGRVILVDESSMINEEMAADMLRTEARFVTCGDPGQLPPVKGKQYFDKAHFTLKTIHRQALDSPIIRQAHRIRLGYSYEPDGDAFRVQRKMSPDEVCGADIVLCWKNITRQAVNSLARRHRGIVEPFPQAGEPVVCLKNAPEYGVFNGGVYTLTRAFKEGDADIYLLINGEETTIRAVKFEGMRNAVPYTDDVTTSFCLGYALTVHKAQGSEWDNVLLIDEYSMYEHRFRWLYTGITRAAKKLTIIRRGR